MKGRIRGAAFRELLLWFEAEHTGETLDPLVEGIADTYPDAFQPGLPAFGVLSSKWYDAAAIHALLDLLRTASGNPRFAEEGGHAVMSKTLSGVFRAMTRFLLTPERYAKHAHRLWRSLLRHRQVRDPHDERLEHAGGHRPMALPPPHPLRHERRRRDMINATIGCEDVKVKRETCIGHGAERCEYVVTWSP